MKFSDAFDEVWNKIPKNAIPKGDRNIPKVLAFLWSMIAVSQNVLDDIVYVDDNNNIQSVPLQKSSIGKKTTKTDKTAKEEMPIEADEQQPEN